MLKLKLIAFILSTLTFLGQTTNSTSPDPWVAVLQWGPAGIVLVLLGSGQLRFNREVKKAEELYQQERADKILAQKERDEVNTRAAGEFIPLLTEATHLLADFKPKTADRAISTALSAIADKLDEIDRKK